VATYLIANDAIVQRTVPAQAQAFRACWSFPIRSDGGRVRGTFALYHANPREPDRTDLDLVRLLADPLGF
jgi:GAF domain-containing protein